MQLQLGVTKPTTYLFFDTETTGLPLNNQWSAPVTDLRVWPRMVQLAWEFYKGETLVSSGDYIINPEGFIIPIDSSNIHGITMERAQKEGRPLSAVLKEFESLVAQSDFLVAHNISFDEKVVGAELLRSRMKNVLEGKKLICTKEVATDFCAIPNSNGYKSFKWPKLSELHIKLFGEDFLDAHNASSDVRVTAKCFFALKKLGVV
jgi:DNA polymerase III epsilon subunit-like protein